MKRLTIEELNHKLKIFYPKENLSMIKYVNMKSEVIIKCNNCNSEYFFKTGEQVLTPAKAKNKKWGICNKCTDTREWEEQKIKFIDWLNNNEDWELNDNLDIIHDSQSHIICKCKKCGRNQKNKKVYDYYNGKKCWCQTKSTKKPLDILEKELKESGYTLLEEYINTDKPTLVKREKCGHIFKSRVQSFLNDKYFCPLCHASKGEQKIADVLDNLGISYCKEFHLYLEDNILLKIDFVIPDKNIYIEFNGKQHYEPIEYFGGKDAFESQQKRDKKLSKYCENNNIKLMWIKDDQINDIENILKGVMIEDESF